MKYYIVQHLNDFVFGFKYVYDNMDVRNGTELTYIIKNGYLIKVRYRTIKHKGYIDCHYPLPLFSIICRKYKNCIIYVDIDRYNTVATYEYVEKDVCYGKYKCRNKRGTNRNCTNL